MKQEKFLLAKRLRSFRHAYNGLKIVIREEHNARIHLVAAFCVVVAGIVFKISPLEWVAIVFAIGFVIACELINSSIENIADFVSPDKHDQIKKIKDMSAAAVLISAIVALSVGLIVFIPKALSLVL